MAVPTPRPEPHRHDTPVVRRFPSSGGVEVVAFDWGGPAGDARDEHVPTVVLAHATGLHSHVWLPVVRRLRDAHGYRCVALDLRGHGDAPAPVDGDFGWERFADDAVAALDGLGLAGRGDVRGVGHSMGGCTLVLAELRRPGTFSHLFLFEAIIRPVPAGAKPGDRLRSTLSVGARRRREVFPSRDDAYANYSAKPPFAGVDPESLRAYVDHGFEDLADGTVRLKCRGESEAATFEQSMTDVFDRVGALGCPVTVAVGERSTPDHLVAGPVLARAVPDGRYLVVPGRTHFGPLEGAPGFADIVADCVEGRPVPGLVTGADVPAPADPSVAAWTLPSEGEPA